MRPEQQRKRRGGRVEHFEPADAIPEPDEGEGQERRNLRWYAVQVASGCENKVKSTLMQRAAALDVADQIVEVVIPKRTGFKLDRSGKRQEQEEKIFPGYVLVRMDMNDDTWMVVKTTPNVINFVGTEEKRAYGRGRGACYTASPQPKRSPAHLQQRRGGGSAPQNRHGPWGSHRGAIRPLPGFLRRGGGGQPRTGQAQGVDLDFRARYPGRIRVWSSAKRGVTAFHG